MFESDRSFILAQLQKDSLFLRDLNIMDYSLLLCIEKQAHAVRDDESHGSANRRALLSGRSSQLRDPKSFAGPSTMNTSSSSCNDQHLSKSPTFRSNSNEIANKRGGV